MKAVAPLETLEMPTIRTEARERNIHVAIECQFLLIDAKGCGTHLVAVSGVLTADDVVEN